MSWCNTQPTRTALIDVYGLITNLVNDDYDDASIAREGLRDHGNNAYCRYLKQACPDEVYTKHLHPGKEGGELIPFVW